MLPLEKPVHKSIKDSLKENKIVYNLNHYIKMNYQEGCILKEQEEYERKAKKTGLIYSIESSRKLLKQRLASRGIEIQIKEHPHVLLIYFNFDWRPPDIIDGLSKLAHVDCYSFNERGFDPINDPDWIKKREKVDYDLYAFVTNLHKRNPIDFVFSYVWGWHISPATINAIGQLGIVTCNWSLDDKLSYRARRIGGRWEGLADLASAFDLNLTNASSSCIKYLADGGIPLVWPQAANPEFFRPLTTSKEYEVSFIGAQYGFRSHFIKYLRNRGIKVIAFGKGWKHGYIDHRQAVEVISKSHINLGMGGVAHSERIVCIKGRDFEVPMSGGLYLTIYNPELEPFFRVGEEIVCYRNREDCYQKIVYLLNHLQECEKIRIAARRRCLQEHTWEKRFQELLEFIGLL